MTKSSPTVLPFPVAVLLLATEHPPQAQEAPAAANPLEPVARLVGQWGGQIEWNNSSTANGYVTYEWGLNQKILKLKTHVLTKEGPRLTYEGMIGWQPEKEQIVMIVFGLSGVFYQGVIEPGAVGLDFSWESHSDQGVSQYRQMLGFFDTDRYVWQAFRKTDAGWEPMMKECTYFRQKMEPTPIAGDDSR